MRAWMKGWEDGWGVGGEATDQFSPTRQPTHSSDPHKPGAAIPCTDPSQPPHTQMNQVMAICAASQRPKEAVNVLDRMAKASKHARSSLSLFTLCICDFKMALASSLAHIQPSIESIATRHPNIPPTLSSGRHPRGPRGLQRGRYGPRQGGAVEEGPQDPAVHGAAGVSCWWSVLGRSCVVGCI